MKILKSLVLALFVITASAVFATPIPSCSTTTLDVYLAQGYECSQGPLLFSDFSFSLGSSGDAAQPTASDVMVNVLGDGFGFLCLGSDFLPCFRAGDVNAPGEYSDVFPYELILTPDGIQSGVISYDVRGPIDGATISWGQIYLGSEDFSGVESWGLYSFIDGFSVRWFGCADCANAPVAIGTFAPIFSADVYNSWGLEAAPGDRVLLTDGIANEFSFDSLPEPSSMWLLGCGIAVLMVIKSSTLCSKMRP